MRSVLGIDAAWTLMQPSGVALAAECSSGWRLIAVAASYQHFNALADRRLQAERRPSGSVPNPSALLNSASVLCNRPIDLVAVDMPLAYEPIIGRRVSDNIVSREYGARKCGTHTPSSMRPGRVSDDLRNGFDRQGYRLLTGGVPLRGLIEVYPHPALVELASAEIRFPYKASKVSKYWPNDNPKGRLSNLFRTWREIVVLLECKISGVHSALPELGEDSSGVEIKAYEDKLDAIVCAWVAICALEGYAKPLGDDVSAIWIPCLGLKE